MSQFRIDQIRVAVRVDTQNDEQLPQGDGRMRDAFFHAIEEEAEDGEHKNRKRQQQDEEEEESNQAEN